MHWLATLFSGVLAVISGWFAAAPQAPSLATTTDASIPAGVVQGPDAGDATGTARAEASLLLPPGSAWQASVPLGDGRFVTDAPKQGYIYLCHVLSGGGAQGTGSWIHGSSWAPAEKVSVAGAVSWPKASYAMTLSSTTRIIRSNGLPTDHPTGTFPIRSSDPAYQIDRNPNAIKAQSLSFVLPLAPQALAVPQCIYGEVGIMNDGVELFDGFDAENRDAVAHEVQDAYEGHPDQSGTYHYHGFSEGAAKDWTVSQVVGFAFDGFPITGSKLPDGTYLMSADLDECHGLTSAVELDGQLVTTYHYVLTEDFPYSVSCFRGASVFMPKGQGTLGNVPRAAQSAPAAPPAAAVSACLNKSDGAYCSFSSPNGTVGGTCRTPPGPATLNMLICVPY